MQKTISYDNAAIVAINIMRNSNLIDKKGTL